MSSRSKYIGQFSKAKLGWLCWWGYRVVRDGQLSETCLTNPCSGDNWLTGGGLSSLLTDPKLRPSKCREVFDLLTRSQRLNGNPRAGGKTANSHPEVKREKWPLELPPLTGFLLFFVTCHAVTLSRNMYIFKPGGLPYERVGDVRRKFWIKPLKKTNLGVGQPFIDP